jgi:hypothetical protein
MIKYQSVRKNFSPAEKQPDNHITTRFLGMRNQSCWSLLQHVAFIDFKKPWYYVIIWAYSLMCFTLVLIMECRRSADFFSLAIPKGTVELSFAKKYMAIVVSNQRANNWHIEHIAGGKNDSNVIDYYFDPICLRASFLAIDVASGKRYCAPDLVVAFRVPCCYLLFVFGALPIISLFRAFRLLHTSCSISTYKVK